MTSYDFFCFYYLKGWSTSIPNLKFLALANFELCHGPRVKRANLKG